MDLERTDVNEVNDDDVLCTMLDAIPKRLGMVFQRDADLVSREEYHMEFADLSVGQAISVSENVISIWLEGGNEEGLITCVSLRKYEKLMDKIAARVVVIMHCAEITDTP